MKRHYWILTAALVLTLGVGTALSNTLTLNHWLDDANNVLVSLGSCLSGESACIGDSPNSFIMVSGSAVRTTLITDSVIANGTGAAFSLPSGAKTLTGSIAGTGAITGTAQIYGKDDVVTADGDLLCTLTMTGTTSDFKTCTEGKQFTADYPFYYPVYSNTTGTNTTYTVKAHNGLSASGGAGGAGDASAANQTTMIGHVDGLEGGIGTASDAASSPGGTGSINAKLRTLTLAYRTEDTAELDGTGLIMAGSVRRDAAATSSGTNGDNSTVNTDGNGLLWTRTLDPCSGIAKTSIPISISTITTTELTAALAGASNHYYVCSIDLVTALANNVALVDDDTDNCASVTSGLAGGVTAATGWNFAANGGIAKGNGEGTVFKTGGTNRVLCLMTSATTQLSGSIQVVAAP